MDVHIYSKQVEQKVPERGLVAVTRGYHCMYVYTRTKTACSIVLYSAVYAALIVQWNLAFFAIVALFALVVCNVTQLPPKLPLWQGQFLPLLLFGAITLAIGYQFVQWRHSAVQPCTRRNEPQQAHS